MSKLPTLEVVDEEYVSPIQLLEMVDACVRATSDLEARAAKSVLTVKLVRLCARASGVDADLLLNATWKHLKNQPALFIAKQLEAATRNEGEDQ